MGERSSEDLGFTFSINKDGAVRISRDGRQITILRKQAAQRFVNKVQNLDESGQQQLMARVTGHYRHGNER